MVMVKKYFEHYDCDGRAGECPMVMMPMMIDDVDICDGHVDDWCEGADALSINAFDDLDEWHDAVDAVLDHHP